MKKLNFLSKVCGLARASQYCDVGIDRRLTVGSPSVLHRLSQYIAVMFLLLVGGAGNVWGTNPTVTYTVTSTSAVTTSGIAPDNSSATFSQTYGTAKQATNGNSFTLTLSNFNVKKVVGFKFSMHSNASQGSGNLSYKVDNGSEVFLVGSSSSDAIGFNSWGDNTAYGNSYREVNWSVNLTPSSSLVIYIRCVTTNSIYIQSFTIEYELDPHTVSFNTGSGNPSVSARTEVSGGDGITLPSKSDLTPAASSEGWELYGWATASYAESTTVPTTTLVGLAGATYYPTKNTTLYAIYKNGGTDIGASVLEEHFSGFVADDVPSASNSSTTVIGGGSVTYTCTGSGTKIYNENTGGGTAPEILVKASGSFAISGIPHGDDVATLTLSYKRNNKTLTPTVSGTDYSIGSVTGSNPYTATITVGSDETFGLTFTAGGDNVRLDDIVITVASTKSDTWYNSNPCVGLGSISGSVTLTKTTRTMTATWAKTSGDHETGYSVQLYDNNGSGGQGSASGAPISITGKETANRTHTFTGLLPNHKYFVGVTPTYSGAGNYCEEGTEVTGNTTTDAGYTVTYAHGTGATGEMTDENSPYDAGATVTVLSNTFEKCGAVFNAWSAKDASEATVDVSGGSFTISSNVTITATWINKQENDRSTRSGSYTTPPALSNTMPGTACEGTHYKFMGWVEASYINEDGSLKDGYTLIPGSESGHCADTKTFYAIWAEEE